VCSVDHRESRRTFLTSAGAGALLLGCTHASHSEAPHPAEGGEKEDEVTPAEDLMREHGVLRRVMFMYDDAAQRLDEHHEAPLDALAGGAAIVRRVIEDYHEKLEEEFLFPRFEKAGMLVELVTTLRTQHVVGRTLTEQITTLAKARLADADRATLATALRRFNHMYRPHAAREDTVLFPALRGLVGGKAYRELGEQFEERETQVLGDHGFEHAVDEVARLEKAFGLDDLAKLTP
jgi:hemerythrin-like domain-containing protein